MNEHQLARVIDGEYAIAATPPPPRFSAKEALDVNAELQAFIKGLMSHPSTWPKISGKPFPPAKELMKLWSPLGCSAKIISRNEHGEFGVRREIIALPGGGTDVKFSCTMVINASRLGSAIEVSASQLLSEKLDRETKKPLSEPNVEQQVQTRCKSSALRALSGFDAADMTKAPVQTEKLDGASLVARAVKLRVIPRHDKGMFLDWAREKVRGCDTMSDVMRTGHFKLITEHLNYLEDLS